MAIRAPGWPPVEAAYKYNTAKAWQKGGSCCWHVDHGPSVGHTEKLEVVDDEAFVG